MKQKLHTRQ